MGGYFTLPTYRNSVNLCRVTLGDLTSSIRHKNELRLPKHDREVGTIVFKELVADFEVLSEIDEEELAGAIAAGAAVGRWPPELQELCDGRWSSRSCMMAALAADLQGIYRSC